jgi:PRC-barrel domain
MWNHLQDRQFYSVGPSIRRGGVMVGRNIVRVAIAFVVASGFSGLPTVAAADETGVQGQQRAFDRENTTRRELESVLGSRVRTRSGRDEGHFIDVLIDSSGRVQAAVIEFGGFLGIGTRKIAVEWPALLFEHDGGRTVVIADVPHEQLRAAPEYKVDEPIVVRRAAD